MRLNLIIGSFYPASNYGGPVFSSYHIGKELASLGVKVLVSTTDADGERKLDVPKDKAVLLQENLWARYYPTNTKSLSLAMLSNMRNDIRRSDMVFLQALFSTYVPTALLYSKLYGKKVLLSPRGSLGAWCLENKKGAKRLWFDLLIKPFSKDIFWHATSAKEAGDIRSVLPDSRVFIVPNGIYLEDYKRSKKFSKPEFMKRYAGKEMAVEKIIISMGRIHKVKGFDILIRAFKFLIKECPSSALVIAGRDNGEQKNLEKLAMELGLSERVFFTGHLEGDWKIDFLANADAFALPSNHENFGVVYAEALAAGTPVIASKAAPWGRLEEHGCGRWVENNAEDFARAISEVLRSNMKKNIFQTAPLLLNDLDWKNIAGELKEILEKIGKAKDA